MEEPIILYTCETRYLLALEYDEDFRLTRKQEDACHDYACHDLLRFKLYHVKYVDDPEGYSSKEDSELDGFNESELSETDEYEAAEQGEHLLYVLQRKKGHEQVFEAYHRPPSKPMEVFNCVFDKTGNPHSYSSGPFCPWEMPRG